MGIEQPYEVTLTWKARSRRRRHLGESPGGRRQPVGRARDRGSQHLAGQRRSFGAHDNSLKIASSFTTRTAALLMATLTATATLTGYMSVAGTAAAAMSAGSPSIAARALTAEAATAPVATTTIGSFKTAQDGTLVTGNAHRSLYILTADQRTTAGHAKSSTCYGAGAVVWPPVLASKLPNVSGLARRSLVGLTTRKDGSRQVTYNGLPLYYYVADTKAGQSVGNHLNDKFGL